MKRIWLVLLLLGSLFSAACGPGRVLVTAEIDVPNPEGEGMVTRPITDTEIELLPFDRDQVFDSLEAAYGVPEPEIPEDLLAAQEEIAAAQEEWRQAEATWSAGRDRLAQITQEMEGLNRAESRYIQLYREFQDVEAQVQRAERVKDRAFQAFTELQEGYIQRADSMKLVQEQWADEAFASAFEVFAAKVRELGREIVVDTTDAQGQALIEVPPGEWWVHARYDLPFSELYWNIPVTVQRGDPIEVRLTRENAVVRPKL